MCKRLYSEGSEAATSFRGKNKITLGAPWRVYQKGSRLRQQDQLKDIVVRNDKDLNYETGEEMKSRGQG